MSCFLRCFKFNDFFFCFLASQDKNQQQHPTTLNILLKHHPETKLPPTSGVAAAFILFDFYQPVPPSGWFSHLSLFFWWSIFLWQNSNPFWDWKVAWLRKVGRRVVKRSEQVPSRSMWERYVCCLSYLIVYRHIMVCWMEFMFFHVSPPTPFSNKRSILQQHRIPFQQKHREHLGKKKHLRPPSKAENKRIMASLAKSQATWGQLANVGSV